MPVFKNLSSQFTMKKLWFLIPGLLYCVAAIPAEHKAGHESGDQNVHQYHSNAPEFSDPAILTPVPDGWISKPVEYGDEPGDADLVIALGQQTYPIFHDLIPEYAKENNLNIVVKQGTCGITSGRLLKKKVDIGAFCCPPGKSDRLPGLKFHTLGIAPIALVVHPDNPLDNVSTTQAKDIFNGQISRWSEIATDNDKLIKPVGRLHCKTRPGHWRSLLNRDDDFSPRLVEVGVIHDLISQVSRSASAIGWETPLMVEYHKNSGNVKMLTIDMHKPSDIAHVLSGQYPLYRTYNLTTWTKKSKTNDEALKLVEYLKNYIEKNYKDVGFIPASQLKNANWKFTEDELVSEPTIN